MKQHRQTPTTESLWDAQYFNISEPGTKRQTTMWNALAQQLPCSAKPIPTQETWQQKVAGSIPAAAVTSLSLADFP
jgi:hypothetical protein